MKQRLSRGAFVLIACSAGVLGTVDCVGDDAASSGAPNGNGNGDGGPGTPPAEGGGTDAMTATDTSTVDSPMGCSGAPTTDFYVDSANGADTNSGGGTGCALKTITRALSASATHYNATIHLAAGTYGAGETLPLVVDHGRSLVGAGAATTTIQGSSAEFNTMSTGSRFDAKDAADSKYFLSILAGDVMGGPNNLGATTLSGFTLVPPTRITMPTTNYYGIACIAGNGPNTGTTPPLPPANLVVKDLTVGPNFDFGISIGSSPTNASACNASIITSRFLTANVGVDTGACGAANPSTAWPSAQVGDGQGADANTFKGTAIGILGEGCGSVQSYAANHFVSGYRGIVAISNTAQYFEVTSNTFDGATAPKMGIGIHTNAGAVFAKLNDNVFTNISQSAEADTAAGTSGYAINFGGAHILQALRNSIHDNDNGLYLGSAVGTDFDFSGGANAVVNRNQFYCNSKVAGGNGYDVIVGYAGGVNTAKLTGNAWDNSPLTTGNLASTNGTDVASAGGAIDTSSPQPAIAAACAAGRVK